MADCEIRRWKRVVNGIVSAWICGMESSWICCEGLRRVLIPTRPVLHQAIDALTTLQLRCQLLPFHASKPELVNLPGCVENAVVPAVIC